MNDVSTKKWYNLDEASKYLGFSKPHMYLLTSERLINFYQPGGKIIFFREEDLDAWVMSGHKETIPQIHTR